MKINANEEYGLRCLVHMAKRGESGSYTITAISEAEGLSATNVAKLMRLLRLGGLVKSIRGQAGGYRLAKPATEIRVSEIIGALGDPMFDTRFCDAHAGIAKPCMHAGDCTIRDLWATVQQSVDTAMAEVTLRDLAASREVRNGGARVR